MSQPENLAPVDEQRVVLPPETDIDSVLEEYRRRQMVEHLTGPVVSVVLHLVVMVIGFFFMVGKAPTPTVGVEFKAQNMKVKEIEQVEKKIEKQVEQMDEVVPTVERPDVTESTSSAAPSEAGGSIGDFNDDMPSTSDNSDADNVLDVKMSNSPIRIAGIYGGRSEAGRRDALAMFSKGGGGGAGTEAAVLNALRWLKAHQNENGSWSKTQPDSMCGLALLCYLAHGELPNSKEFGPTVEKAMRYLIGRLNATNGNIKYSVGYVNGIVVYAVAEAYGMTKNPALKEAMEKGIAAIINGQQAGGGFDYGYAKNERWDLSLSGWQIQALKAGFLAGSDHPKLADALQKAADFVQKTTYARGRFGYCKPGIEHGNYQMSAVGTLCLQLLGRGQATETQAAIKTLNSNMKVLWNDPARQSVNHVSSPCYGWYYATQAMFYQGGKDWKDWDRMFARELCRNQEKDGHWDFHKTGATEKGSEIMPYYTTTLCCLMLEVYYRFLPSYKMDLKKSHSEGAAKLELE